MDTKANYLSGIHFVTRKIIHNIANNELDKIELFAGPVALLLSWHQYCRGHGF